MVSSPFGGALTIELKATGAISGAGGMPNGGAGGHAIDISAGEGISIENDGMIRGGGGGGGNGGAGGAGAAGGGWGIAGEAGATGAAGANGNYSSGSAGGSCAVGGVPGNSIRGFNRVSSYTGTGMLMGATASA